MLLPVHILWHTATRQYDLPHGSSHCLASTAVSGHLWRGASTAWPLCVQGCDVTAPWLQTLTSQWEDTERRKPGSEVNSGLCHRLVTSIQVNNKQAAHKPWNTLNNWYIVMKALVPLHTDIHIETVQQTLINGHKHLWAVWGHGTCARRQGVNLWSVYF